MSDTPITDANIYDHYEGSFVDADVVRDLERKLARALRVVEAAKLLRRYQDDSRAKLMESVKEWEAGR